MVGPESVPRLMRDDIGHILAELHQIVIGIAMIDRKLFGEDEAKVARISIAHIVRRHPDNAAALAEPIVIASHVDGRVRPGGRLSKRNGHIVGRIVLCYETQDMLDRFAFPPRPTEAA